MFLVAKHKEKCYLITAFVIGAIWQFCKMRLTQYFEINLTGHDNKK